MVYVNRNFATQNNIKAWKNIGKKVFFFFLPLKRLGFPIGCLPVAHIALLYNHIIPLM
jgi:hypothetical protein